MGRSCCGTHDDEETRFADEQNWVLICPRGLCSVFPFTDALMTVCFTAFLAGMLYVFGVCYSDGNLNRLEYGTDYSGLPCGDAASGTGDYRHQYWPNPLYFKSMGSICLDACPGNQVNGSDSHASISASKVYCVCNNNLTMGRGVPGVDPAPVENSLRSGSPYYLARDCNSDTCTNSACVAKGKNWVLYDNPPVPYSITDPSKGLEEGLYYYLPNAWQYAYPTGVNSALKWMVPQCNYQYSTFEVLNRCIPKLDSYSAFSFLEEIPSASTFKEWVNSFKSVGGTAFADLKVCWRVIGGSIGIAVVCGFAWILFMKSCAFCVVWTVILLGMVMSLLLAGGFAYAARTLHSRCSQVPLLATYDTDHQNMYICYAFAGIFGLIFALISCATCCYCKQIRNATDLISLASEALLDFPYLIGYPFMQIVGLLCLVVGWAFGAALLASSGDQIVSPEYGTVRWAFSDSLKYMMWYWLFGFLWIIELMMACGVMIVSCCFAIWFFSAEYNDPSRDASRGCCGGVRDPKRMVPSWVLVKSMKITYFYHFGTCAFGALIIAIVDLLRILLEYIDKKRRELERNGNEMKCSKVWEYVICVARCFLKCLDCCMRYLNKQAYIQTVINGTSLCASACGAISCMLDQLALFAILGGIQSGVFLFVKIAICMSTAAISAAIINFAYGHQISSIVLPTFVCLLIGYGVANSFVQVYDMGIDTMLMCYAESKKGDHHGRMHIPHQLDDEKQGSYTNEARKKLNESDNYSSRLIDSAR